jgi:hypothetical protein
MSTNATATSAIGYSIASATYSDDDLRRFLESYQRIVSNYADPKPKPKPKPVKRFGKLIGEPLH